MFFLSALLELNLNLQIKIFTQKECEQIHILMSQTATNLQWSSIAGLVLKNSIFSPVFTASPNACRISRGRGQKNKAAETKHGSVK